MSTEESCNPCLEGIVPPKKKEKGSSNKGEERRERTPFEKAAFYSAWTFLLICAAYSFAVPVKTGEAAPLLARAARAGIKDLLEFLSMHLISAMIPAFFLASAISTFFSKETIVKTMGRQTNPLLSYSLAALSGAILTVCSCGILPIFMAILESGAGIGPAITFLYSSPAINPISLIYTWKIIPFMLWPRIIAVFISAVGIGYLMSLFFRETSQAEDDEVSGSEWKGNRTPLQNWSFFFFLLLIMMTSTDALSSITSSIVPPSLFGAADSERALQLSRFWGKIGALLTEIAVLIVILGSWFTADERRKWLKRTWRQASEIIPMVFLGIFYSGMLGGAPSLVEYLGSVGSNTIPANLIASFIGSMLYFGSIVGVNIVDLFIRWGMHKGPALALLLSGPAVSLPSVLALIPIVGKKKAFAYLMLVIVFSMFSGFIYGQIIAGGW